MLEGAMCRNPARGAQQAGDTWPLLLGQDGVFAVTTDVAGLTSAVFATVFSL